MFYLKHPDLGNRHVANEQEAKDLVAAGWVRWPRTKAEKNFVPQPPKDAGPVASELVEHVVLAIPEQPKRRGRPPKVRQWPDQQT